MENIKTHKSDVSNNQTVPATPATDARKLTIEELESIIGGANADGENSGFEAFTTRT